MSFEADQAALVLTDPDVVVVPVMAIHGTQVPWGKVVMDGVPVVPARRLPRMLRALPAVLGSERVVTLVWPTRPGSASTPPSGGTSCGRRPALSCGYFGSRLNLEVDQK